MTKTQKTINKTKQKTAKSKPRLISLKEYKEKTFSKQELKQLKKDYIAKKKEWEKQALEEGQKEIIVIEEDQNQYNNFIDGMEGKTLISEQWSIGGGDVEIQLAKGVDIEKLTEGDDAPMFITREAIHEGKSKNNRIYSREEILNIQKQVMQNKHWGYNGHLSTEEVKNKKPNGVILWIGTGTKEIDGKLVLYVKGYVLPKYQKIRDEIKRAVAVGKDIPLSVYGQSQSIYDKVKKAIKVVNMKLWSIDLARDLSQGVPALDTRTLITSEMSNNLNSKKNNSMDYDEIELKKLKEKRPDLVQEIEEGVEEKTIVSEMADSVGVESSKLKETVAEMAADLKKSQELVSEMKVNTAKNTVESILSEHVTDNNIRLVVSNIIEDNINNVISEMVSSNNDIDSEKLRESVLAEMKDERVVAILKSKNDSNVPANHSTNGNNPSKYKGIKVSKKK